MRISRLLLSVFAVVGIAVAQDMSLNFAGYDTCKINNFAADTLRVCKTMNLSNAENKLLIFCFDDTANAARKNDTICAEIGYQLGAPFVNLSGVTDTLWTNFIPIDTLNGAAENKEYNPLKHNASIAHWALDASTDLATRPHGQIDSTIGTSQSAVFLPFTPYWSPYIRFYIHGLTNNTFAKFLKAKFVFIQRKYVNVRNQ